MNAAIGREIDLGSISQIPYGEGREFVVAETRIAVFRARTGAVYATAAACPHRDGPLADGLLGGTTVVCPFHGWRFDLVTGKNHDNDCTIKTYPARIGERGEIRVTIG